MRLATFLVVSLVLLNVYDTDAVLCYRSRRCKANTLRGEAKMKKSDCCEAGGNSFQKQANGPCVKLQCPDTCWTPWSDWDYCALDLTDPRYDAGVRGIRTQKRLAKTTGGCKERSKVEKRSENVQTNKLPQDAKFCPVDGGWSNWSAFGDCDAVLQCSEKKRKDLFGNQMRNRTCTNPEPKHGGKPCVGQTENTEHCYLENCPVHGGFCNFSEWSQCSSSCTPFGQVPTGFRQRCRRCECPSPKYGGNDCEGTTHEVDACPGNYCPVNGVWSSWTAWSPCSTTSSGWGTKRRQRECDPLPRFGGNMCSGSKVEETYCRNDDEFAVCPYASARNRRVADESGSGSDSESGAESGLESGGESGGESGDGGDDDSCVNPWDLDTDGESGSGTSGGSALDYESGTSGISGSGPTRQRNVYKNEQLAQCCRNGFYYNHTCCSFPVKGIGLGESESGSGGVESGDSAPGCLATAPGDENVNFDLDTLKCVSLSGLRLCNGSENVDVSGSGGSADGPDAISGSGSSGAGSNRTKRSAKKRLRHRRRHSRRSRPNDFDDEDYEDVVFTSL